MLGASSRRVHWGAPRQRCRREEWQEDTRCRLASPSRTRGGSMAFCRSVAGGVFCLLLLACAGTCTSGSSKVNALTDSQPAGGGGGSAGGAQGAGSGTSTDAASAPPGDLSVGQVLGGADAFVDEQLTVVGSVFEDVRQKIGDWPAPSLSSFILQDGGDVPAYGGGGLAVTPYIQLYSTSDLSPYLHQNVRVSAFLRRVVLQYPDGQSAPFLYLEVTAVSVS